MTAELDPYSILGIAPSAESEEIKTAYRRAARRLHPDVNRANPGAAVQFQDISAAYETLIDTDRRRDYDKKAKSREPGIHFNFRVTPSKRAVMLMPESQVIYLLAEILPDPRAGEGDQKRESRLNLTLVLDRSNSMNGPRMDRVKVAAHNIIDQLTPQDVFSVVAFNDFSEIIIPATTVTDKASLKARVSMITASGGTEIFKGLQAGVEQTRKFLAPRLVNHIMLLTDGNTYGDQQECLRLAREVSEEGISISAIGLGHDWNDVFLDELATSTGGSCTYVNAPSGVVKFMNDHVRNLANVFAERMQLSIAPDPDVKLESAFKLAPNPQPIATEQGWIPLGSLQFNRVSSVLLQFELPAVRNTGFRSIARLVASGDVLVKGVRHYQAVSDVSLEMSQSIKTDEPPASIIDAISKLTLYRMQERAQQALDNGNVHEATQRLEKLATRLLELGESSLAAQAQAEARQVAYTNSLSEAGRKELKYHTRSLFLSNVSEGENKRR